MTVSELIEKLRTEAPDIDGEPNGCYAVLHSWVEDIAKIKGEHEKGGNWLGLFNRLHEIYWKMDGFFWGLHAMGFLSDKEQEEVHQETLAMTRLEVRES